MSQRELVQSVDRDSQDPGDEFFRPIAGALVGAAAADALGWITEFVRGPDHLRKLYGTGLVEEYRPWQKASGGRFNTYIDYINAGEYSDDTQLTLAVARSINADGSFDAEHFSKRELPLWLQYVRGAGSTITAAARAIGRKKATWNRNFFTYKQRGRSLSYRDAGANGAAMRVAPIALANINDRSRTMEGTWRSSITTHGHPRAILGALVHAEALRLCALKHRSPESNESLLHSLGKYIHDSAIPEDHEIREWISLWNSDASAPFEDIWQRTQDELLLGLMQIERASGPKDISEQMKDFGCFDPATKGSGTGTVLAGLLLFSILGDNFRDAVVAAINQLGSDTDTIGAFVGGLCGARHGYENVPEEWATELQDYDYLVRVATELSRVTARDGLGGKALLPEAKAPADEVADLLELLGAQQITKGERVHHPLLGTGWVESVDAQQLRRRDGAQAVFAYVRFDIGQSCKFRFMRIPQKQRRSGQVTRRVKEGPAVNATQETQLPGLDHEEGRELTADELRLLRHLAAGTSTREIAALLQVSSAELKKHLATLFQKLGTGNGEEALKRARNEGLI